MAWRYRTITRITGSSLILDIFFTVLLIVTRPPSSRQITCTHPYLLNYTMNFICVYRTSLDSHTKSLNPSTQCSSSTTKKKTKISATNDDDDFIPAQLPQASLCRPSPSPAVPLPRPSRRDTPNLQIIVCTCGCQRLDSASNFFKCTGNKNVCSNDVFSACSKSNKRCEDCSQLPWGR